MQQIITNLNQEKLYNTNCQSTRPSVKKIHAPYSRHATTLTVTFSDKSGLGGVAVVVIEEGCFGRDCSTESTIPSKASGSDVVGVEDPVEDPFP